MAGAFARKDVPSDLATVKDIRVYCPKRQDDMRRWTRGRFFWCLSVTNARRGYLRNAGGNCSSSAMVEFTAVETIAMVD
jgi:hypothetical protein